MLIIRISEEMRHNFIEEIKVMQHLQERVKLGRLLELVIDDAGADGSFRHYHFLALFLSGRKHRVL